MTESNFIKNTAKSNGGAVFWSGIDGTISSSYFNKNNAPNGGAIYISGGHLSGILTKCNFTNNNATYGGAVDWDGTNGKVTDCNFINNSATNGGAVMWSTNGANGTLTDSNFTNNAAINVGGGIYWNGAKGTLENCIFTDNNVNNDAGGGIFWNGVNGTLKGCTFIGNNAKVSGGAVDWWGANSSMSNCDFTNNHANNGDNVYWRWDVEEFLNKYGQINDNDYILLIQNGVGTPSSTIVLNKKGITITSEGNVTFDAKGKNLHFEVTGDNVLIEKITFRNFNFNGYGGAIYWVGNNGILKNCNFFNLTAGDGGAIYWRGNNGILKECNFFKNTAKYSGGAIWWNGINGTIIDSNFSNNFANMYSGGAICWSGANGKLISSAFNNNAANKGGAVYWQATNGILSDSNFSSNSANIDGGAVNWVYANGSIISSNFINNSAKNAGGAILFFDHNARLIGSTFKNNTANVGGAVYWANLDGIIINSIFTNNNAVNGGAIYCNALYMINCSFVNDKWVKSNGIYIINNLKINGGKGIVDIFINGTLSGTSILVLNNETYYYPPNSNINFINKNDNDRNSILIIKIKSYYMKALVSDNSGTLLERYRAIKDIENDEIFTNINSLNLIDSGEYLNLVVLQFDTTVLLDFPRDMLISDIVHKYKIDFDVSFHSEDVSRTEIAEIIYNDSEATIGDIVDCFMVLKEKIPKIEICNGSALIVDIKEKRIKYTITSAGKLFPSVKPTIEKLQEENIKIFIASGDRKGAIQNLATLLNIPKENAYGTVTTEGKCKIVKKLQNKGFRVLMVGDGLNDILAFKTADISVLTVEQEEEISEKLLDKTDFIIKEFSEIIPIIERDL